MKPWAMLLFLVVAAPTAAQTTGEREPPAPAPVEAPPPPELEPLDEPPLPPKAVGPDELVPAVRIRREEGQTIEEYSIDGRVYMVKITPAKGPAYYLIDTDGDGDLETRDVESDSGVRPVYWKLLEWD